MRLLEVGTGSGGVAHFFAHHPELNCEVESVDVEDVRQIREGFRFTKVSDEKLPFPDASFDVVVTNHVIEHVGDEDVQRGHLVELRRVLRAGGIGYLAVPNRWQWVEPHYKLAGLSWLPESWRSPYLRFRNRGDHYDCRPLTVKQMEILLHETGFDAWQQHGRALRMTFELEHPDAPVYRLIFRHIPDGFWALLRKVFPTLIYIVRPSVLDAE